MSGGFGRLDTAHGNLLRSAPRVAHQLQNLSRDIVAGADATQILGSGVEALAHSFNLGLGAIAAGYIGGALIGQIAKAGAEITKLHDAITMLAANPGDRSFETFNQLDTRIKATQKHIKELMDAIPIEPGRFASFKQIFGVIAHPIYSLSNAPERDVATAQRSTHMDEIARAKARAFENSNQEMRDSGNVAGADRMKALHEMIPKVHQAMIERNMALAAEELRAYANTIKEINKKEQEQIQKIAEEKKKQDELKVSKKWESMQLSLADLAAHGREWAPGMDIRPGAGRLARQATKEEGLARKEMLAEHYGAAAEHQQRADAIKNSITPLKDSEKDFLSAIERAEVFKKIETNTRGRLVNK